MTKPYKYQRVGIRKIQRMHGNALLADEMGLGKSAQALWWVQKHLKQGLVLIVCPASLKWNWQNEIQKHLGMSSVVLEGKKPYDISDFGTLPRFIIINYDILSNWESQISELRPRLIICDEIHKLGNRRTIRTKCVSRICRKIRKKIFISGTPITNRPAEIWPTLNILRPQMFPSFFSFAMEYTNAVRTPWGWQFKGAKNTDKLNILLQDVMIRRRKSDVLGQLPKKIRTVVPVSLKRRKEYDFAVKDFIKWLRKKSKRKARRAKKAIQLVKLGYLKRLASQLKLNYTIEWIQDFLENTNEKLIVFGVHQAVLEAIESRFKNISVLVDGGVTGHKRQLMFERFTHNPKVRLFIGNINAAGVGWNGTAASAVLFSEIAWTPGEHIQAEDRIHRIGQTKGAMIYYLVAKNTIEEDLLKLIQDKQKILDATIDGGEVDDTLDIFDQLIDKLTRNDHGSTHHNRNEMSEVRSEP